MRGGIYVVTALDVANNVIRRALNEKQPLSPMKLQKLIYFIYAKFYAKTDSRLFSERFGTWKYGPVLDTVYQEFREFHDGSINRYCLTQGKVISVDETSSIPFKESFDDVWCRFGYKNGLELSQITHTVDSAWYRAYVNRQPFLDDMDIKKDGSELFK